MTDVETLAERVRAVERTLTDDERDRPAMADLADLDERVEALEREVSDLNERTDELEAATQALRGYVGNVRSVNERVESRADAALAATERLERRLNTAVSGDRTGTADGAASDQIGRENSSGDSEDAPLPAFASVERDHVDRAGETNDSQAETAHDAGVLERIRSLV